VSRVQLALNVADLTEAVDFYSTLLGTRPAKLRPGYANFVVTDPPLKLVLIENGAQAPGSLNHLGIEVESSDQVVSARARLAAAGLATTVEDGVSCCYAVQDKVWVDGPGGEPWEVYTVLTDTEGPGGGLAADRCCGPRSDRAATAPETSCC
jgi:catechol 2,3-dioxygenase-like lactoylglutathione lyase family enzyme